jgi:hypothetical protein
MSRVGRKSSALKGRGAVRVASCTNLWDSFAVYTMWTEFLIIYLQTGIVEQVINGM